MAHHARQLAAANPGIGDRIRVLHGKVEEVVVPEKVSGWALGGGAGARQCGEGRRTGARWRRWWCRRR